MIDVVLGLFASKALMLDAFLIKFFKSKNKYNFAKKV